MTNDEQKEQDKEVEAARFATKPVLVFGAGVVAALGVVYVLSAGIVELAGHPSEGIRSESEAWPEQDTEARPGQDAAWPPPLQGDPETDYERLLARQRERLESYGWIDRERDIVHIPIERAMDLVLRDGPVARESSDAGDEGGT